MKNHDFVDWQNRKCFKNDQWPPLTKKSPELLNTECVCTVYTEYSHVSNGQMRLRNVNLWTLKKNNKHLTLKLFKLVILKNWCYKYLATSKQ